jgi:uncharacterized membrane protein YqiK
MEWQTVAIFAGLAVLAIMLVISMLARLYRKVGPNEALLVYGRGKTPRVVKGAGTVIWPLIESCRLLSLELMSFDVAPQQDLYTNQGVAVTVEAVAQIKVKSDDISIRTGAEQFLTKTPPQREGLIRLVMEGHLRGIIGQLTVEQIVKEPEMVGDRMRATCAGDMSTSPTWAGLTLPASSAMPTSPPQKPSAIRPSRRRKHNAPQLSPAPRLTRNACWRKHFHRPNRQKRNATLKSRKPLTLS